MLSALGAFVAGAVVARLIPRALASFRKPNGFCPPLSWFERADPGTQASVISGVSAGFKLAQSMEPAAARWDALRQATFAVPQEIARFITDAPDFRIEEIGPCAPFSPASQVIIDAIAKNTGFKPAFDIAEDTKVFLYFPNANKGQKATAAFVAINTDQLVSKKPDSPQEKDSADNQGPIMRRDVLEARPIRNDKVGTLIAFAVNLWLNQYSYWVHNKPEIIVERIAPGSLPVIFCLQDKACGCTFDQKLRQFPDPEEASRILQLTMDKEPS